MGPSRSIFKHIDTRDTIKMYVARMPRLTPHRLCLVSAALLVYHDGNDQSDIRTAPITETA